VFIQMEDEMAGIAACIGASQGGMKAMTATSGPGFSLMQENLGLACMTEIPLVIVDVQRCGPSTGQPTRPSQGDYMQAIWGTHGDHPIIVVSPSSVQEMLTLTVRAFNLAERFRSPVVILADEVTAHMREKVELPTAVEVWERPRPTEPPERYVAYAETGDGVPPMAPFGEGGYKYHVTGLHHDVHGFPTVAAPTMEAWMRRAFRKIEERLDVICAWTLTTDEGQFSNAERGPALRAVEGAEVLLISFGASARTASGATRKAREQGRRVASLRLQTVWPLDDAFLGELLSRVPRTLVIEMNRGQLVREIERAARGRSEVIGVHRFDGEMVSPDAVLAAMEER
jgi:2-oxoglutarate ferredoxin oxidoreductase subunit alpha